VNGSDYRDGIGAVAIHCLLAFLVGDKPPSHARYRRAFAIASVIGATIIGFLPCAAFAADTDPVVFGIPVDFILFAITLIGVGLFHHHTLGVAITGLGAIIGYKLLFTGFKTGAGLAGLSIHFAHEWVILANLLGLLLGFALLAKHFEESHVPKALPRFLPDDWKGSFVLLALIFALSAFLDNIAAALIGGTIAGTVFRGRVHIGYLAAIVAASNAGGAGSVVGDTTTTMMWIDGVAAISVLPAFIAAFAALVVLGVPAAVLQHRYSPIMKDPATVTRVDWMRVGIVLAILVAAVAANVILNAHAAELAGRIPVLGLAVWAAILLTACLRRPEWSLLPEAFKGSVFLLALVSAASLMPVEKLPAASWQSAFVLGFVSSVFDNIPLTALALKQGGYDWAVLAFAVGFGGSMIWFGSSAGVAISNMYPEAKSVVAWLRHGWFVLAAYVIGFFVMLALWGWHPDEKRERPHATSALTFMLSETHRDLTEPKVRTAPRA
jgi:Na+/H+ antiporter NhaD/arsenite permease-like protein